MSNILELSDVACFANERISINEINNYNYISTENMIVNKGGIKKAASLPSSKTVLGYKPSDILISNIRLYFEKIWFATKKGGASSDVLVVRVKEGYSSSFIYYLLSDSNFFKYADVTSKGTKMPRGDKKSIMKYSVPIYGLEYQEKIAKVLSTFDKLIENNNRRIEVLEQTAEEIYKEWFVRMRFPGYENTKLVKGIPEGWEVKKVNNLGEVVTGKTPSTKVAEYYGGEIMFIKTPDMHGNIFTSQTETYLSEDGSNSQANKLLPQDSIMVSCIGTGGVVSINMFPAHTNQQINSIILEDTKIREWTFLTLKSMKQTIELFGATGATMTNLSKGKFEGLKLLYPSDELLNKFNNITKPMFEELKSIILTNENLKKQRDLLLPRLMNGSIKVK